jgi:hypothetical protein
VRTLEALVHDTVHTGKAMGSWKKGVQHEGQVAHIDNMVDGAQQ